MAADPTPNEVPVVRPGDPYPWAGLFRRIEGLVADRDNVLLIEPEVVPVIFVPGLLGSRLRTARDNEKAWDPDDPRYMFGKYGVKSIAAYRAKLVERKTLLLGTGDEYDPDHLVVDTDDAEHNGKYLSGIPKAVERGWGGVVWGNYGEILREIARPPTMLFEPVRHCVELPVHAFGYDWTQATDDTVETLVGYVNDTVQSYRTQGRACDHVIFVTHSMGGLVARAAAEELTTRTVLGAIHCGQPAAGAASAYWRMKAGVERPAEGRVLDRSPAAGGRRGPSPRRASYAVTAPPLTP